MQQLSNVPHGSGIELWHGFALSTIFATLAAVRLWLNRNKPSSEVYETNARAEKTRAEARRIDADSSAALGEIFRGMSAQALELHEHIRFLQSEVQGKTNAEQQARDRSHDAIAEVQRCIFRIRDYEELLTNAGVKFEKFEIKNYKQIMGTEE